MKLNTLYAADLQKQLNDRWDHSPFGLIMNQLTFEDEIRRTTIRDEE